jgi:hypothetical protein
MTKGRHSRHLTAVRPLPRPTNCKLPARHDPRDPVTLVALVGQFAAIMACRNCALCDILVLVCHRAYAIDRFLQLRFLRHNVCTPAQAGALVVIVNAQARGVVIQTVVRLHAIHQGRTVVLVVGDIAQQVRLLVRNSTEPRVVALGVASAGLEAADLTARADAHRRCGHPAQPLTCA